MCTQKEGRCPLLTRQAADQLQEGQITDEARRLIERELDLEEASLAFNRKGETDPPL